MKDQVKNEKEKEDWKVVLLMSMRQISEQTAHWSGADGCGFSEVS